MAHSLCKGLCQVLFAFRVFSEKFNYQGGTESVRNCEGVWWSLGSRASELLTLRERNKQPAQSGQGVKEEKKRSLLAHAFRTQGRQRLQWKRSSPLPTTGEAAPILTLHKNALPVILSVTLWGSHKLIQSQNGLASVTKVKGNKIFDWGWRCWVFLWRPL